MKPHPIPNRRVCSECGLDWQLHPDKPRRRDCIKLLREAKRPWKAPRPWVYTFRHDIDNTWYTTYTATASSSLQDLHVRFT